LGIWTLWVTALSARSKVLINMFKFDCSRCGDCCKNLVIETIEGVHSGLALFLEETKQFPSESVFPYRGFGRYPEDKNFKIVMFQLGVDTCPHLKKVDNQATCNIYDERPLSCKCYPFEPISVDRFGRLFFNFEPDCRAIQKMKRESPKVKGQKVECEALNEEKSGYLLWDRMPEIHMPTQEWTFDLRYREWLPRSRAWLDTTRLLLSRKMDRSQRWAV